MRYQIASMHCDGCARGVTKAIQGVDPGAEIAVDVGGKSVEIRSAKPSEDFRRALDAAGFPAVPA